MSERCRRVTRRDRSHQPAGNGISQFLLPNGSVYVLTLLCTPGNQHCLRSFKAEGPSGCSHSVGINAFLYSSRANAWNPYSTLAVTRLLTNEYSRCLGGKGPILGIPSAPVLIQYDLSARTPRWYVPTVSQTPITFTIMRRRERPSYVVVSHGGAASTASKRTLSSCRAYASSLMFGLSGNGLSGHAVTCFLLS